MTNSKSNIVKVLLVNGTKYTTEDVEKLENKAISLLYENKQYKKAIDNICSLQTPARAGKNTNFEKQALTPSKQRVGIHD